MQYPTDWPIHPDPADMRRALGKWVDLNKPDLLSNKPIFVGYSRVYLKCSSTKYPTIRYLQNYFSDCSHNRRVKHLHFMWLDTKFEVVEHKVLAMYQHEELEDVHRFLTSTIHTYLERTKLVREPLYAAITPELKDAFIPYHVFQVTKQTIQVVQELIS